MNIEWLNQLLGEQWNISPAGGATGEAYIAELEAKRLFLKRNSSPFLAVLSAEGIVPKLLWTKRLENGDVISAQEWLDSKILKPEDMARDDVASLLKKIHSSKELLNMLQRIRKKPYYPSVLFEKVCSTLDEDIKEDTLTKKALAFLQEELPVTCYEDMAVCHGDVNHNNWIVDEIDQLYLIDWDGAVIADPAMDVGMLLYCYIPTAKWQGWLHAYGLEMTDELLHRMKWYAVLQTISSIQWYKTKDKEDRDYWYAFLQNIL
ncbi:phosphotransferase family protein [Priestia taiwanensis]|uniref:Phosphotransferase n=1 Tax=Priestia taiwanensis TaxID=1347902 RepID=A0A917ET70_9BACI|nr:phosphotransferase family protein [Priestia taiwanensis]MBM7363385.1 thiamine kinase-like enzyme [Priestia taiwanensis]GGE77590.1 phosphotransferase [Priestia taiwanensis]